MLSPPPVQLGQNIHIIRYQLSRLPLIYDTCCFLYVGFEWLETKIQASIIRHQGWQSYDVAFSEVGKTLNSKPVKVGSIAY